MNKAEGKCQLQKDIHFVIPFIEPKDEKIIEMKKKITVTRGHVWSSRRSCRKV